MLDPARLAQAFAAKRDDFPRYELSHAGVRRTYTDAWQAMAKMPLHVITADLTGSDAPGALPTPEWADGPIVGTGHSYVSHAESHAWAAETLAGRVTLAVDGSQIEPQPAMVLPVAVVQVSRFVNPHDPDRPYLKD